MRIGRLEISLMIVLIAQSAGAVDGVAEISETCAAQTGCFGGDLPGYPVTIDGFGITAELGSTVSNNTALENMSTGMSAGHGSTVSNNTAADNSSAGFALAPGSTISAYRNGDSGISASSGSAVQGNTVYQNGTFGDSLGTTTPYLENVISNNSGTHRWRLKIPAGPKAGKGSR